MTRSSPKPEYTFYDFRRSAIEYAKLIGGGNSRATNKVHGEMLRFFHKLKEEGRAAEFVPLLEDPDEAVRYAAAAHLLEVMPEVAVPVLQAIAKGPPSPFQGIVEFTLWMWREGAGRLH